MAIPPGGLPPLPPRPSKSDSKVPAGAQNKGKPLTPASAKAAKAGPRLRPQPIAGEGPLTANAVRRPAPPPPLPAKAPPLPPKPGTSESKAPAHKPREKAFGEKAEDWAWDVRRDTKKAAKEYGETLKKDFTGTVQAFKDKFKGKDS